MVVRAVCSAVLMVFCVVLTAAFPVDFAVCLMALPLRSTVLIVFCVASAERRTRRMASFACFFGKSVFLR